MQPSPWKRKHYFSCLLLNLYLYKWHSLVSIFHQLHMSLWMYQQEDILYYTRMCTVDYTDWVMSHRNLVTPFHWLGLLSVGNEQLKWKQWDFLSVDHCELVNAVLVECSTYLYTRSLTLTKYYSLGMFVYLIHLANNQDHMTSGILSHMMLQWWKNMCFDHWWAF